MPYPYLSGQGSLYEAARSVLGNPLGFRFCGNVSNFEVEPNIDTEDHQESTTGQRAVDLQLQTGIGANVNMTFQEFSPDNLAMLNSGTVNKSTAGTITNEIFTPATLEVGKSYQLANPKASSLVITDSAATPATLGAGTDYNADLAFAIVKILQQGSFVAPLKASYTKAAGVESVAMLTSGRPERWFKFLGLNTATPDFKRFMVDLYRVVVNPGTFPWINTAVADFETTCALLQDPTKPADTVLGQFGKITWID